ncbi:MAG: hypothetical protein JNL87_08615 [Burkholderiaceae bacterium]|nr:hypothetical protein [Burkholderiaceae bacterium]
MTQPERKWLAKALQDLLLPKLEGAGFTRLPLSGPDASSAEIRAAFPFGRLRRARGDGFDQVEIQLDKRGSPAFRLNMGVIPRQGIAHPVAHVEPEQAWVQYLPRYCELYQRAWTRTWFKLSRWPGASPSEADYRALVERAAALLPEIESAFDETKALPFASHLRRVRA